MFAPRQGRLATPLGKQSAEDAFMAEVSKSPAERMQEAILKSLGITPEEYENMPPEEKKAVDQKFADVMKQRMEEQRDAQPGALVDQIV
jgi:hypothetical protein